MSRYVFSYFVKVCSWPFILSLYPVQEPKLTMGLIQVYTLDLSKVSQSHGDTQSVTPVDNLEAPILKLHGGNPRRGKVPTGWQTQTHNLLAVRRQ